MKKLLLIVGLCLLHGWAFGATHYASPTGSASWANSTNISTPCSAATAFANAVAGDTVLFRDGTYNVGADGGDGYVGALNPANSGTQANPIVFKAYTGELPILYGTTSHPQLCRVIGMGDDPSISWITIDGFKITSNKGASVILGSSSTPSGQGYVLQNCEIANTYYPPSSYDDNFDLVRIGNASTNVTIKNNKIHGGRRDDWGGSQDNFSGIKLYTGYTVEISNNEIYDCMSGISHKRFSQNILIFNNYAYTCKAFIHLWINTPYTGNSSYTIYNNVANLTTTGGSTVISTDSDTGPNQLVNTSVYNNTFRNTVQGGIGLFQTVDAVVYNNIVSRSTGSMFQTVRASTIQEADYNQWGTGTFSIRLNIYDSEVAYNSLAAWQASGYGTGDLASDPLFTNGSGNFSLLSDFALQAGSPCKGTGKAGADMGANVALVGPSAGTPAQTRKATGGGTIAGSIH